jgi:hypothetical protein
MAFFMNEKFLLSNIVSEVEYLEKYFNSRPEYVFTNGMKKYPVCHVKHDVEFLELVHDIIRNRIGIDEPFELIGDNFYEHSFSYFPHCDALQSNSWLNIVIPIKLFDQKDEQKFIVFDQQYMGGTSTWMGSYNLEGNFLSNKKIQTRICDTESVIHQTELSINDKLYKDIENKYLSRDYLFSMSGDSFSWTPGSVIVFDSRFIHTTGKMNCSKKLGLSVRIGYKK